MGLKPIRYFFSITASDAEFYSSIEFVANIKNTNDPPSFFRLGEEDPNPGGLINLTCDEDSWYNFTCLAVDPDNDMGYENTLHFSLNRSNTAIIRINSESGNFSFKPTQQQVGFYYVKIKSAFAR